MEKKLHEIEQVGKKVVRWEQLEQLVPPVPKIMHIFSCTTWNNIFFLQPQGAKTFSLGPLH